MCLPQSIKGSRKLMRNGKLKELLSDHIRRLETDNVMNIDFDVMVKSLRNVSIHSLSQEELNEIRKLTEKLLILLERKKKELTESMEFLSKKEKAIKAYNE